MDTSESKTDAPELDTQEEPAVLSERTRRSISTMFGFVRSRQLEGTFPGDRETGTWDVTAMRIACGWGVLDDADWPKTTGPDVPWPCPEPPGLDEKARRQRINHYHRVRTLHQCCYALGRWRPIAVIVGITEQWFEAPNGIIELPRDDDEIIATHCVSLMGFNLRLAAFIFLNSWGKDWGHGGFGYMPFDYLQNRLIGAWDQHIANRGQLPEPGREGTQLIRWVHPDYLASGGAPLYGVEMYDATGDDRQGWAFAVHRDGFLDIEELFVKPEHRRKGVATQLADELLDLIERERRPVRMWVPFADWTPENIPAVEKVAAQLGLRLFEPGVRWAAAVGLDPLEFSRPWLHRRHPNFTPPLPADPLKHLPPRPASVRKRPKEPRPGTTTSQTGPRKTPGDGGVSRETE